MKRWFDARRHPFFGPALLSTLLVLAACQPAAHDSAASLHSCRLPGVERELRCGSIDVPENPDEPSGRAIGIHFAVLPAIARAKAADPVFVLAGGPGQAAIETAHLVLPLLSALNTRRDIVLVDQRGTGSSAPIKCKGSDDDSLADSLNTQRQTEQLARCLHNSKADPRQYATWIAVRDLDAVRGQLGAPQINLWGASYGTRVALEYLRQFPQRVRSAVLDGVAPPTMVLPVSFSIDADSSLKKLIAACSADAHCQSRYPDLQQHAMALLEKGAHGIHTRVAQPLTGVEEQLSLDRSGIASMLRLPLYAPSLAALLPYAISEAERENFQPLATMSAAVGGDVSDSIALGMHFAVICAEDIPRINAANRAQAAATTFGTAFIDQYQAACKVVPTRPVPAAFYELSASTAPVLLLSGGMDPATPPRHAEAVAEALGNAKSLVAPNLGHGISGQGCAPDLIARFIREASFEHINGACLDQMPMPTFYQPLMPTGARR